MKKEEDAAKLGKQKMKRKKYNVYMYSHRVDIENRLSYPNTVKKGHLSMMGFDEMKAFDEIDNGDIHWDDANPAEHAYPAILRRY